MTAARWRTVYAVEFKMLTDIQGPHGVHVRRMHTVDVQARHL